MPTSGRNRPGGPKGFTLFELLVTLSILSFGALMAANAFRIYSPRIAVDQTAEQLVADLKRARLHARETGARVSATPTESGYRISQLNIRRNLRSDLDVRWNSEANGAVVFTPSFANLGGVIEIRKGRRRAVVRVHPITGKVERIE